MDAMSAATSPEQNGCNAHGSGAMPTDRVYRAHRQERVWNLESHNAKESGISSPIHNPGLGRRIKGATSRGALHLLRGAAPDQNGCNAYRSGAMPTDRVYRARRQERVWNLESRNAKESGLNTPTRNRGLGRPATARDARAFEKVKALRDLRSV